jgi:hypothetical protein
LRPMSIAQPSIELGRTTEGRRLRNLDLLRDDFSGLVRQEVFNEMLAQLPALTPDPASGPGAKHPPGWFAPHDLLVLTLAWAASHKSEHQLQRVCGMDASEVTRALKWTLTALQPWADSKIGFRFHKDRLASHHRLFPQMPQELELVTVEGDTTDIPRRRCRTWSATLAKTFHSFKLKRAAWRLMVPLFSFHQPNSPNAPQSPGGHRLGRARVCCWGHLSGRRGP